MEQRKLPHIIELAHCFKVKILAGTFISLLLMCLSCFNPANRKSEQKKSFTYTSDSLPSIDSSKNSVFFSREILMPRKIVDKDSIYHKQEFPLIETKIKIPKRAQPAGTPKLVASLKSIPTYTPGTDDIPLPDTFATKGIVVPFKAPQNIDAPPLRFKDGVKENVQVLDLDFAVNTRRIEQMFQDSRGHIWFGTKSGAIRYDGKTFNHFTTENGLCGNHVAAITEDTKGNLWFATLRNGACKFDGQNFIHFPEESDIGGTLMPYLLADTKGSLWFALKDQGLIRYDGSNVIKYSGGILNIGCYTVFEDSKSNIWFGLWNKGIAKFDGQKFSLFTRKEGIGKGYIWDIKEDHKGNIWIASTGGLYKYDGSNIQLYTKNQGLIGSSINQILADSQHNLWFINGDGGANISNGGVSRLDGKSFTHYTQETGLPYNRGYSLLEDSAGNIWIGTVKGAARVGNYKFKTFNRSDLAFEQMVSAITDDAKGNLWLGTWGNGLIKFDGFNFTYFHNNNGVLNRIINILIADKNGQLWFDNGVRGIGHFDGSKLTHYSFNDKRWLFPLLIDSKGGKWFGTNSELIHNDGSNCTIYKLEEHHGEIMYIQAVEDEKGNIWFGTTAGCLKFKDDKFTLYTKKEEISDEEITALFKDTQDNIWIGTLEGLSRFNGDKFITFTSKDGLMDNHIYSITEDKNRNIWVASHNGISVLSPIKEKTIIQESPGTISSGKQVSEYRIFSFGKEDGINDQHFISTFIDKKNKLWLGGENGLTSLDLNKFNTPADKPKIYLNNIDLNKSFVDFRNLASPSYHRTLPFKEKIEYLADSVIPFFNYPVEMTLPSDINNLTFHFSVIDWMAPNKIRLSYLLEGKDEEWSNPQNNMTIEFQNLSPGTYTLKAKAIGGARIWSNPFTYKFIILPPWYLTWWALMLWALIFLGGIFWFYQFLLRRQLAESEAYRLKELDTVKNHLYTNITHEFRTPLTVILGMAEQIQQDPRNWLNEGLKLIRRNGRQLLSLVNQMLDLSKIESGHMPLHLIQADVVSFIHYLVESFHSMADGKDIRLHFLSELDELIMDHDPEKLQQIISNLLSNAIKFTPSGGDIYLQVASRHEQLELIIKDTGPGIPQEDLPHIFERFYQVDATTTHGGEGTGIGLALTRELVKLMGGNIRAESGPTSQWSDRGARFTVTLPISRKAGAVQQHTLREKTSTLVGEILLHKEESRLTNEQQHGIPLVLLIEDNADVVTYLTSFLSAEYQIATAPDGLAGVELATEIIPDLIVSDVMMPRMDGFEVCARLKSDERTDHIPIILLTAKSDHEAKIEGLSHGADAYLAKPFSKEELLVRIEKLIESRRRLQKRFQSKGTLLQILKEKATTKAEAFLQKVVKVVEENLSDNNFGMPQLCKELHMSRTNLFRKLKALTGKSATQLIRTIRLAKAMELLQTTDMNVTEVTYEVGFNSPNYFSRMFQMEYGMAPSEVGKGE